MNIKKSIGKFFNPNHITRALKYVNFTTNEELNAPSAYKKQNHANLLPPCSNKKKQQQVKKVKRGIQIQNLLLVSHHMQEMHTRKIIAAKQVSP